MNFINSNFPTIFALVCMLMAMTAVILSGLSARFWAKHALEMQQSYSEMFEEQQSFMLANAAEQEELSMERQLLLESVVVKAGEHSLMAFDYLTEQLRDQVADQESFTRLVINVRNAIVNAHTWDDEEEPTEQEEPVPEDEDTL